MAETNLRYKFLFSLLLFGSSLATHFDHNFGDVKSGYHAEGSSQSSQYLLPSGVEVTHSKGTYLGADGIYKTFEHLKHEANQFVSKEKDSINVPGIGSYSGSSSFPTYVDSPNIVEGSHQFSSSKQQSSGSKYYSSSGCCGSSFQSDSLSKNGESNIQSIPSGSHVSSSKIESGSQYYSTSGSGAKEGVYSGDNTYVNVPANQKFTSGGQKFTSGGSQYYSTSGSGSGLDSGSLLQEGNVLQTVPQTTKIVSETKEHHVKKEIIQKGVSQVPLYVQGGVSTSNVNTDNAGGTFFSTVEKEREPLEPASQSADISSSIGKVDTSSGISKVETVPATSYQSYNKYTSTNLQNFTNNPTNTLTIGVLDLSSGQHDQNSQTSKVPQTGTKQDGFRGVISSDVPTKKVENHYSSSGYNSKQTETKVNAVPLVTKVIISPANGPRYIYDSTGKLISTQNVFNSQGYGKDTEFPSLNGQNTDTIVSPSSNVEQTYHSQSSHSVSESGKNTYSGVNYVPTYVSKGAEVYPQGGENYQQDYLSQQPAILVQGVPKVIPVLSQNYKESSKTHVYQNGIPLSGQVNIDTSGANSEGGSSYHSSSKSGYYGSSSYSSGSSGSFGTDAEKLLGQYGSKLGSSGSTDTFGSSSFSSGSSGTFGSGAEISKLGSSGSADTFGSSSFSSGSSGSFGSGAEILLNQYGSKLGSSINTDTVGSSAPVSFGIATSFSSSSSNINGKKTENRHASVTVNDNGKVDTYDVKSK